VRNREAHKPLLSLTLSYRRRRDVGIRSNLLAQASKKKKSKDDCRALESEYVGRKVLSM
jgi:hypothetical protein